MRTVETIKERLDETKSELRELTEIAEIRGCKYAISVYEQELTLAITADIPLDRLEAICTAEKENRCVVLPCKVGDTVWLYNKKLNKVCEFKIDCIKRFTSGISLHGYVYGMYSRWGTPTEITIGKHTIGKTVFIGSNAREQAEKMLGGVEG